jgi:hypothetical protein
MNTPNVIPNEPKPEMPEWHEAFPEPQTIPAGWDISSVLAPAGAGILLVKVASVED